MTVRKKKILMTAAQTRTADSNSAPAALIIVAAGSSTRMGGRIKKEYLPLNGGTVLSAAARIFFQTMHFTAAVIAVPAHGEQDARAALFADPDMATLIGTTQLLFVPGGATRQESVRHALEALYTAGVLPHSDSSLVLIHDGARPFVTSAIIKAAAAAAETYGAAVPALQPVDTQKETDKNGIIIRHLQRKNLAAVQTPQAFRFYPLLDAHRKAAADGCDYTDDTEIWGKYAGSVKTVPGDSCNKKITYPGDLPQADKGASRMIRTGLGYDLHPLVEGRKLLLGGIQIPFDKGEDGHSDGDVLFHAITDALLGASGLGDIGSFFPPSDPTWKDADSAQLLRTVWEQITAAGWKLGNLDCVIALEQPKFLPYREQVRESIAKVLHADKSQIFVKAKTGEKLGVIGEGKAVEVWSVCLLEKQQA